MLKSTLAFVLVSSVFASTALADELAAAPRASEQLPSASITVSPFHAFIPMAELTAELRAGDRVGLAVIGGFGVFHDKATARKISLFEAGASARYYVLGSFRSGLQLGAEAVYVHASTDAEMIAVKAAGLAVSPFAGYKWTHGSGFTLEGQLGASFMALRAKAETGPMAEDKKVGPMLNLQVGYSF